MKKKLFSISLALIILSAVLWFIGLTTLMYFSVKLYGSVITIKDLIQYTRIAAIPWLIGIISAIGSLATFICGWIVCGLQSKK